MNGKAMSRPWILEVTPVGSVNRFLLCFSDYSLCPEVPLVLLTVFHSLSLLALPCPPLPPILPPSPLCLLTLLRESANLAS